LVAEQAALVERMSTKTTRASLKEMGLGLDGEWEVKGNELRLHFTMGLVATAEIKGNKLYDEDGKVWVKEGEASPALPSQGPTLTIVLQADLPKRGLSENDRAMERAISIINRRFDAYGVIRPIVQQQDSNHILVQLPGFTDIEVAKALLQTGFLEFREAELDEDGSPVYLRDYLDNDRSDFFNTDEPGYRIFVATTDQTPLAFLIKDEAGNLVFTDREGVALDTEELKKDMGQIPLEFPGEYTLLSWIPARGQDGTRLTGDLLANAQPDIRTQTTGAEALVAIEWDKKGGIIFNDIAERLYYAGPSYSPQRALGIFLDNTLLSHPNINFPKYSGRGVIEGNFTIAEAEELANLLKSGSLPVLFNIVEWHTD
jgi:preprotein translocase subunit SecD